MEPMNVEAMLSFAIEKEQEAAEFYVWASGLSYRPNLHTMFLEMAEEERKHEAMLKEIEPKKVGVYPIEQVRDLKISDYLVEAEFSPDMSYQDALILAMKREEKAHQLYSDMGARTDDPELKKLFAMLAQEEAKHKLRLETEYDEYVLAEN